MLKILKHIAVLEERESRSLTLPKTYLLTSLGTYFLFVKMTAVRSALCNIKNNIKGNKASLRTGSPGQELKCSLAQGRHELRGPLLPHPAGDRPATGRCLESLAASAPEKMCCQNNMLCLFAKEYTWSKISGLICLHIFVINYVMSVFSRSVRYYAYIWACQRHAFTNACLMWMHLSCYSNNEYFLLFNTFYLNQFEN